MPFYPGVQQQGVTLANVVPQTSGATTTQTATVTGSAGSKIVLRKIVIFGSSAGATCTLIVKSGTTAVINYGTITLAVAATIIDTSAFTFADGATCNVVVGASSAGTTTISLIADKV